MNSVDLVRAALAFDDLAARQWVKDAKRLDPSWFLGPCPEFSYQNELVVYAALVELFAERAGVQPPAWTASVEAAPEPVYLDNGAYTSSALKRHLVRFSPEPLRKRNVFAADQYLDVM